MVIATNLVLQEASKQAQQRAKVISSLES